MKWLGPCVLSFLVAAPVGARAQEEVVVLEGAADEGELGQSLRLELGAEGFEAHLTDPGAGPGGRDLRQLQTLLEARGAVAAVWVEAGPPVTLCLLRGGRLIRSEVPPGSTSRAVALLAVGLLGDALALSSDELAAHDPGPEVRPATTPARAVGDRPSFVDVEIGGASIRALMPTPPRPSFEWRLTHAVHFSVGPRGQVEPGGHGRMELSGYPERGLSLGLVLAFGMTTFHGPDPTNLADRGVSSELFVGARVGSDGVFDRWLGWRVAGRVAVGAMGAREHDVGSSERSTLGLGAGAEAALDLRLNERVSLGLVAGIDVRVPGDGAEDVYLVPSLGLAFGCR